MTVESPFTYPKPNALTLAVGQTVSPAIDLAGGTLVGLYLDDAFSGSAVSFLASADGVTYVAMKDEDGSALSITAGVSRFLPLAPARFAGVRFLKVVSGTTQATTASVYQLSVRPV